MNIKEVRPKCFLEFTLSLNPAVYCGADFSFDKFSMRSSVKIGLWDLLNLKIKKVYSEAEDFCYCTDYFDPPEQDLPHSITSVQAENRPPEAGGKPSNLKLISKLLLKSLEISLTSSSSVMDLRPAPGEFISDKFLQGRLNFKPLEPIRSLRLELIGGYVRKKNGALEECPLGIYSFKPAQKESTEISVNLGCIIPEISSPTYLTMSFRDLRNVHLYSPKTFISRIGDLRLEFTIQRGDALTAVHMSQGLMHNFRMILSTSQEVSDLVKPLDAEVLTDLSLFWNQYKEQLNRENNSDLSSFPELKNKIQQYIKQNYEKIANLALMHAQNELVMHQMEGLQSYLKVLLARRGSKFWGAIFKSARLFEIAMNLHPDSMSLKEAYQKAEELHLKFKQILESKTEETYVLPVEFQEALIVFTSFDENSPKKAPEGVVASPSAPNLKGLNINCKRDS